MGTNPKMKKHIKPYLTEMAINKSRELEYLCLLQNILDSGDCNVCSKRKDCEYKPGLGELVRYNCPFYERRG